ncbi:MAG: hypothetical protein K2L83_08440 [Muribaculaceae bacterium]|nr:hypothetical protein [Muribaculaceae bacterium]MDE6330718.1 hypothetical protein [Muribaculaceae bacterium]
MCRIKLDLKNLTLREGVTYLMALLFQATAIAATFIGLFLPPPGKVDSSIISLMGITSAFCGAAVGIATHYDSKKNQSSDNTASGDNR